ncbi:MAG: ABC transporter permease, partial [Fidelibacterota bacterium]
MNIATEIARKFALGGKGSSASRVTGWIAILGMGIGGFALIVSVAVMQGFESQVIAKIVGFEGDIRVIGNINMNKPDHPAVKMVMPFMERKGLVLNQVGERRLVQLKAVAIDQVARFYTLQWTERDTSVHQPVFVGQTLARRLQLQVGDKLRLLSPVDSRDIFGLPRMVTATIGGIFQAEVLQ